MKQKIVVDLGVIPYEMIADAAKNARYDIIFIGNAFQINPLRELSLPNMLFEYSDFTKVPYIHDLSVDYNAIFNEIIDDYNTMMIAERVNYRHGYRSNHNDIAKIDIMIEGFISFFTEHHPKFVFYQACPHNINSWLFTNVAEKMGVRVYVCNSSIFFWRNFLLEGVHEENIVSLNLSPSIDQYSMAYMEKAQQNYEKAIPSYEQKRLQARKNRIWSWRTEIKAAVKDIRKMYALPLKYKLYKAHQKFCKIPDLSQKYIIVFLHYQPERTSMPEGKYFANQWHLINTLHRALPKDYKLYIKEHPSTFTNSTQRFDPRYRNPEFYQNINNLSNTVLVDLSVDSFTLIDKSQCVATITGTVGGEALLRGKPVLVFGNATYRGHKYAYPIKNTEDVVEALKRIERCEVAEVRRHTMDIFVPYVMKNSVIGIDENIVHDEDLYKGDIRNKSISRLLIWVLENI